jgi:integrase/recombinase XerD
MIFRLQFRSSAPAGISPYRIVDEQNHEIAWLNEFLDAQRARGLSLCSVRAYAYDLLDFARWWFPRPPRSFSAIDQSTLFDYLRHQRNRQPTPMPQTLYHRVSVLRCLYRFRHGREIPRRQGFSPIRSPRSPFGYGGPRLASTLGLKRPRRLIVPLSPEEVTRFWRSLRTFRDLGIVALMLFDGLRSQEVRDLQLQDFNRSQALLAVRGKGNKPRILPLPADTIRVLENYLQLERPLTSSAHLFVSLKGPRRGRPMTPAGLRSLFRHHRQTTKIFQANPHRFRHTFGADMVRAGVSLPALMHLMGHSHIHTTMLYVQLSPQDVWNEFNRAVHNRTHLNPQKQS